MSKSANPGEQVTLRAAIHKAEKAAHVADIKKQEATNAAVLAAVSAARAEEALNRADKNKADYNDVAKAYNDAEARLSSAVEAENKAWDNYAHAEARLSSAVDAAKAAYAI